MSGVATPSPAGSMGMGTDRERIAALQAAAAILARTLRDLARLSEDLTPPGEVVGVWADDENLYIESHLHRRPRHGYRRLDERPHGHDPHRADGRARVSGSS